MTLEQVLDKIKQDQGEAVLENGRQLAGLFADYSRGQLRSQANALDFFLKCGGNTRVLALRGAPEQTRRTEYYRLIREMTRDYSMQEAAAQAVCAAFWRVSIGTEPPAPLSEPEPAPNPEPTPEPQPAPLPEEKAAPSAADVHAPEPNQAPPLPEPKALRHTWLEKATYALGWILLCPILAFFAYAMAADPNPKTNPALFMFVVGAALLLAMQYLLWKKRILHFLKDMPHGLFLAFSLMMVILTPSMVLEGDGSFTLKDTLIASYSIYFFLWNLIPFLEKRKSKRGGKK